MTILDRPALDTAIIFDRTLPRLWTWTGDLDVADAAALSTTWQSLLRQHPASVVIDLTGVTFLDCSILSVLVRANQDPLTRLLLHGVPTRVNTLLQNTGLGTAFARALPRDLSSAA